MSQLFSIPIHLNHIIENSISLNMTILYFNDHELNVILNNSNLYEV